MLNFIDFEFLSTGLIDLVIIQLIIRCLIDHPARHMRLELPRMGW
jgi:hypothetical protein